MDTLRDLELLIESRYPIIAIESFEEQRVELILQRTALDLEMPLFVWTVADGLRRSGSDTPLPDGKNPARALAMVADLTGDGIFFFKDLHRFLTEMEVVRRLHDTAQHFVRRRGAIVLSGPRVDLPDELRELTAPFKLELPNDEELRTLARRVINDFTSQHRVKVQLSDVEFERLVDLLKGLTLFEAERVIARSILDDLVLDRRDLEHIAAIKKDLLEREALLDFIPAQETMTDIGGLEHLKAWLAKRRQAFTAEGRTFGLTAPKGILLIGVQGCGKSLVARAIARDWGLPLLRFEPARLYDKYIGESEKHLERALSVAERLAPCVVMIDEIEKGFAYGGSAEADAGLSRRVFGRLLTWLQERTAQVFVAATCNDILQLPPELVRKGRFDEIFFIDLPRRDERKAIFEIHLRKRKRDPGAYDLESLADASEGFSGAEIEQAIVSASYTAFAGAEDVTTAHILDELRATHPLSAVRQEEISALRQWAQGRTVMAG